MFADLPWDIVLSAFAAGLLVLLSHVPLGREVLKRGIIFIDLAVAQAAATGALLASQQHLAGWWVELSAGLAALLVAAGLHQLERRWPDVQEPIIGCTFVVLASLGILLVAADPHGGEHYTSLLQGDILFHSDPTSLLALAISALVALTAWQLFRHPLLGFYLPFAIAITTSVQIVGVYLVFASLILPALVVWQLPDWKSLVVGWGVGAGGYFLGLWASLLWDLPTGPAIVVGLATAALLSTGVRLTMSVPQ